MTTEVLAYQVETLSPFPRPFCLQLFYCLVVTLFVEVRSSQHGEQIVRPENARAFTMAPPTSIAMLAISSGYQLE